jgi:fructose/tagatose bisphosphate aldolase
MQKQESRIDFICLKEIRKLVNIPLVLHGFSGLIEEELKKLGPSGIQKVNIGPRIKKVFTDMLRRQISQNPRLHDHIRILKPCVEAVKEEVIHKMKMFGCINKA